MIKAKGRLKWFWNVLENNAFNSLIHGDSNVPGLKSEGINN